MRLPLSSLLWVSFLFLNYGGREASEGEFPAWAASPSWPALGSGKYHVGHLLCLLGPYVGAKWTLLTFLLGLDLSGILEVLGPSQALGRGFLSFRSHHSPVGEWLGWLEWGLFSGISVNRDGAACNRSRLVSSFASLWCLLRSPFL
jgi:hypothetical protein